MTETLGDGHEKPGDGHYGQVRRGEIVINPGVVPGLERQALKAICEMREGTATLRLPPRLPPVEKAPVGPEETVSDSSEPTPGSEE